MNFFTASLLILIIGLLGLLVWSLRRVEHPTSSGHAALLEEASRRHPTYFPVIRQAMSTDDFGFLAERGSGRLVRRAHRERQRIALLYLRELRRDFESLLHLARIVAVLSPEVAAAQEFERLRLNVQFRLRYQVVLWALRSGLLLLPQLCGLSVMVSQLSATMDVAMTELGERAAVAAEIASSVDRRRLDVA